ncbi:MAG: hypothetical protein RIM68_02145, partial [Arenibacter sp.]
QVCNFPADPDNAPTQAHDKSSPAVHGFPEAHIWPYHQTPVRREGHPAPGRMRKKTTGIA